MVNVEKPGYCSRSLAGEKTKLLIQEQRCYLIGDSSRLLEINQDPPLTAEQTRPPPLTQHVSS
jgi:hypothetical protein